ncbi:MAG: 50S ribosomal protein L18 [Conexivisphaerales archaeon]
MKDKYTQVFRRRREGKTDYKKRRALVISRIPFVSVFISSKNVYAQIARATPEGDKVIVSANSLQLRKSGWNGSGKSLPACYLTGLLLGKKAKDAGLDEEVILYTGLRAYVPGSRLSAVAKGLVDSGIKLRVDEESLPEEGRVSGEHIAEYARHLKGSEEFERKFSALLSRNLNPEGIRDNFEAVKAKIAGGLEK